MPDGARFASVLTGARIVSNTRDGAVERPRKKEAGGDARAACGAYARDMKTRSTWKCRTRRNTMDSEVAGPAREDERCERGVAAIHHTLRQRHASNLASGASVLVRAAALPVTHARTSARVAAGAAARPPLCNATPKLQIQGLSAWGVRTVEDTKSPRTRGTY